MTSIDTRVNKFAKLLNDINNSCGLQPHDTPRLKRGVATSYTLNSRGGELSTAVKRMKWKKCIIKQNKNHHDILSEMVLNLKQEYLRGDRTTITKVNNVLNRVQRDTLNELLTLSKTGARIGNAWNKSYDIMKFFYNEDRHESAINSNSPIHDYSIRNVMEINEPTEAESNEIPDQIAQPIEAEIVEPRQLFMGGKKSKRRKKKTNKKRKTKRKTNKKRKYSKKRRKM